MPGDSIEQRARGFIDDVIRINAQHGMGGPASPADYEQAVQDAAEPARRMASMNAWRKRRAGLADDGRCPTCGRYRLFCKDGCLGDDDVVPRGVPGT
jgi:hypothetical protein